MDIVCCTESHLHYIFVVDGSVVDKNECFVRV